MAGLFTFHFFGILSLEQLTPAVFAPWHMSWVAHAVPEAAKPSYISAVMIAMLFGMYVPIAPLLWYFSKSHMRHRSSLFHQVRSFSFASAQCREESDRVYVQEQVRKWFGSVERFEEFVRLRGCARSISFGPAGALAVQVRVCRSASPHVLMRVHCGQHVDGWHRVSSNLSAAR